MKHINICRVYETVEDGIVLSIMHENAPYCNNYVVTSDLLFSIVQHCDISLTDLLNIINTMKVTDETVCGMYGTIRFEKTLRGEIDDED